MESQNRKEHDEGQRSGPPPDGDHPTGAGGSEPGPRAIATDDPAIRSGPASPPESKGPPDQTSVVETSRIRGPDEAINPHLVVVPVESASPPRDRSGAAEGAENVGEPEAGKGGDTRRGASDPKQDRKDPHAHPAKGPSTTRMLLYSGLVALVCGVAGAWAYSYFFGSSKEGQKSAGKDSGSKQGSDSSDGSDSGKGSDSDASQADSGKGDHQTQEAWLAAVKELRESQAAEKEARRSEGQTRAILDFFKRTLLAGGRSGDTELAEAFWAKGQGKDVSLRKALDGTEPQVAEAFGDQPLAEASVREMLGTAYLNVGEPARAVTQYQRALALREAVQGPSQPDTASCRNQLAVAYRLAGRTAEAGRLFERNLDSPTEASALAVQGSMLLLQKKPAEAELKLRECLTIRQKIQPDDWTTFDTKSSLGEALLEQSKFADAEPLLLSGYQGMKQRKDAIPAQDRPHLTKALERLVRLYDAWGKKDEAMKWRKEFAAAG